MIASVPKWTIAAPMFAAAVLLAASVHFNMGGLALQTAVARAGAPDALVGMLIAAIVLLPEGGLPCWRLVPTNSKPASISPWLMLSLFVTVTALRTGRTIILHGVVLLVVFVFYLFTIVVP